MEKPTALIFGGTGALGSSLVEALKTAGWDTTSVDVRESTLAGSSFIVVGESHEADGKALDSALEFNLIAGVAGGWAGGSIGAPSVLTSIDKMIKFNLNSAIVAAYVAQRHLFEGGLLILTGASSALAATPMMIGYGITKAAVHQLVVSLGDDKSKMPKDSVVIGILPVTIDTPANRQSMPKADTSTWTPTTEIANVLSWSKGEGLPKSGSLIEVVTESGNTEWITVTINITRSNQ